MLPFAAMVVAVPAVILSAEHQAMTKVAVGDVFPELSGQSAAGEATALRGLLGEKATVVATAGKPDWMQAMMRSDLVEDFAAKYAERGVSFVSLDGGLEADAIRSLGVDPQTLDEKLGVRPTPHVYVLGPEGKLLWFDLEYTLSTHRELHATLDELVGEKLAE
ncbi:hypothetical protein [Botrimarina sp.]|uniref:TlpA family protein disulfide reductase n=1 Tax=Botrimarina sp. TaxID=2795802 RepID=UPI0032ECA82D